MICNQCGTQLTVADKFCPKCGKESRKVEKETTEITKKGFLTIGFIVFMILLTIVYFIIFLVIFTRWIIPMLSEYNIPYMFPVIFIVSIIASFITIRNCSTITWTNHRGKIR